MSRYISEFKVYLRLSGPMLVSQLSQMLMGTTDVVMAGQLSALDLAAVAIGGSILWPVFFLVSGPVMGLGPICAQLHGGKLYQRAGYVTRQALMLSALIGLCGFLILQNSAPILQFLGVPENTTAIASGYLSAVSWGFWGLVFYNTLRNYSEAANLTLPVSALMVGIALINIPANYVFMYGKLGAPALGAIGCGVATSLMMTILALVMLLIVLYLRYYKPHRLFKSWQMPDWSVIRELFTVGMPMGLAIFVEITIFSGAAILVSSLGEVVVAGHQIALNFASITFMIPLALGLGATVRIGNLIGAGRPEHAVFSGNLALILTASIAVFNALLMWVFAEEIVAVYGAAEAVQAVAVMLFIYAAIFQIPDGLQVCMVCILRGYKITLFTLWTMIIGYWVVGLPLGYMLGLSDILVERMGVKGMWLGMIAALVIVTLILTWRLRLQMRRAPA